ncbi:MAG: hypothetical protein IIB11_03510 [Chloroflexi bacterium]|nr:hypothetical protein [Chloroflexota bacterium]
MSRKYLLLGLIIIPLIIAACAGSDDTKEALATAEASLAEAEARAGEAESALAEAEEAAARAGTDAAYREQVRFINGRLEEAIRSVSEILDQTYATKGRLLDVLREANLTETFEGMLASFERLTPPPGYGPDHQIVLKAITDSISVSQNRDQTI